MRVQKGEARRASKFIQSACYPSTTGQTGATDRSDQFDRSDRVQRSVKPAQGAAPDFQAEVSGRGYLEDKCAKAARKAYKLGTYLWTVAEQVH